jgi:hypothetical protein
VAAVKRAVKRTAARVERAADEKIAELAPAAKRAVKKTPGRKSAPASRAASAKRAARKAAPAAKTPVF